MAENALYKIKELKNAGLFFTSFGMQSGSERMRKIYGRPESLKDIKKANEILHKLKILHLIDLIVDNPCETLADLIDTLDFLLEFKKPFAVKTFDLQHFPETNLTNMLLSKRLIFENEIEGNFKTYGNLTFRVLDRKVSLPIEEKYIVALIQMTGNIFVPNLVLKWLRLRRKHIPHGMKKFFIKIVLANWYEKNNERANVVVTLVRNKGIPGLITKIFHRFVSVKV